MLALAGSIGIPAVATAAVSIDAVYFGQSHVQKADNPYFGLVSNRDALIKAHVVDPTTPPSPPVTATLTLDGQNLILPLTGPAVLPASVPDGLGVVQHSYDDSFTATIPAAWVQPGLEVTVNAGTASTSITNIEIGAPTRVIMRMFDVHYFGQVTGDYPAGWEDELEAKWPVAELEVRRLPDVVFPELVIPPRAGLPAARVTSPSDYLQQTGQNFDGEQAAALAWNGALKRAGGRSGRVYLSYINIYGVNAGGQAGGFSGVGNGTSAGILHHELGHALSLPHWGNNAAYPYKGAMHGIQPPASFNETHAGPAWAFDLRTGAFIPPTAQPNNVSGHPAGTYKVDPMQGGGTGWQEPGYLLNHFSDYSMNQMRNYLDGHVVVWNQTLGQYAGWNQATGDYTNVVSNNGVQYPIEHDADVITVMASVSGANPGVNMVYPPIGPYVGGRIKTFDPTVPAERVEAQAIFAPANGCDVTLRILQGGVEKTYMLAASWEPGADPLSGGSLKTEAVNLLASDGEVTRVDLLLTPDAEDNGLPADPEVLYTWSPVTPDPATFEVFPTAGGSTAITMRAIEGTSTGDPVEYLFTETTGNPGGDSSGWQSSPTYTDIGLQPATAYAYTVTMRAGTYTGQESAEAFETTNAAGSTGTITVDSTQQFNLQSGGGLQAVTGLGGFDAAGADKLVVVVSTEHGFNNGDGFVFEIRYNGILLTEAVQEDAGPDRGTAAIFYLDDPGPIGAGTIEVSASNPNGGIGAAYALSGTAAGYGAVNSVTGDSVTSVGLTTSGDNALVIAVIDNAGKSNSAGTPTANPPLTQVSSGSWGSQWGGHASGYQEVATPSAITPTFSTNTGSGYSINIAAAEFLAAPVPPETDPPTLAGSDIVDDKGGGPISDSETVLYTVSFSEAMDPSTVGTADFENGGSPAASIDSVSATADAAVFEVTVTPGGAGTLQLQVAAGANLEDLAGNALDTSSAIPDDTVITVEDTPPPAGMVIIDDSTTWDHDSEPATFDFSGSDKLVVILTGEHHFGPGNFSADVTGVTYNGEPLVQAVEEPTGGGSVGSTSDIWYLDNPGAFAGPGTIEVANVGNNWVYTAVGLSGTAAGVGATAAADGTNSVDLTTTAGNSMVVAAVGMGGLGNTANVDSVGPNAPLIQLSSLEIGNNWAGHVTGTASIASAGSGTYSFNTSNTDISTIAVEFPPAATDYDTWAALYPGADLTDPDADFDRDGRTNNEERIWGLDPTTGASSSPIHTPLDEGSGEFTYTRRDPSLTGLNYEVWTSIDLVTWTLDTGASQSPGPPDGNDVETVSVTISAALL
ncbi:MAG: hypothetical protein HKN82_03255, partial [Akkermansiaceae bacterium]|nr:hypothetical protein [Akkermansiaceae bacterium]